MAEQLTLPKSVLDLGFTPEGLDLSLSIHAILLEECLKFSSTEPEPMGIHPKVTSHVEPLAKKASVFNLCMSSGADGMGYGEHYIVQGDGKKILMGNPDYLKSHYGGRPKLNPHIGECLWAAAQRVHNLLIADHFIMENNGSRNVYQK